MEELNRQLKIIASRTEEIIPLEELKHKLTRSLRENKPLRIKFGIDPTGSEMHVGHAVPLRKLKQFQELGHSIEFIIGSFTAKIGDPTGRNESRKMLTDEQIAKNCETYLDQASNILDISKLNIHYNADWLAPLKFEDIVNIMSHFSLSLMISREDFANRLKNNVPISLVELSYPLMQAYDSVHLKSDIEIGGTEQKFNLLRARDLQRSFGQEPQVCLTLPILEGLNGKDKMSKSLNNYIAIKDEPNNMFGKIMSINDDLIKLYYKLVTELSEEKLENIYSKIDEGTLKPYEAKKDLAREIVELYYSTETAEKANEYFNSVFSKKEATEALEKIKIGGTSLIDLVTRLANVSKTQARRLINSNSVKIDNVPLQENDKPTAGFLKIGKKVAYILYE